MNLMQSYSELESVSMRPICEVATEHWILQSWEKQLQR